MSVVIVAHNNEEHIGKCIRSVLVQTVPADEIVLVVHNSIDRTFEIANNIAKKHQKLKVIPFNGATEISYARVIGIKHVTGDIVLCTEGNSFAQKNWINIMMETLSYRRVLVGSYIRLKGTLFGYITNFFNKGLCVTKNAMATVWICGPSFAFWKKDKMLVIKTLQKSSMLSDLLGLSQNPDNYWLAFTMLKHGNIQVTNKTSVTQYLKEISIKEARLHEKENRKNAEIISFYIKTRP